MKETFYFPHDNNAINDPKMMNLFMDAWLIWVWLYWILVEIMHQQDDWKITEDQYENYIKWYSSRNKVDIDQLLNVFLTNNLFIKSSWMIYSERVLENKEFRDKISKKRSEAWKKGAEKRTLNSQKEANAKQILANAKQWKEIKGNKKEIKIKEIIVNKYPKDSFEYTISKEYFNSHCKNWTTSLIYLLNKKSEEDIIQEWCEWVDKLKRIDKYTEKQISFIINFTIWDDFRFQQIQNTMKFRKKNKEWIPYFVVMINEAKKNQNTLPSKDWWWIARI